MEAHVKNRDGTFKVYRSTEELKEFLGGFGGPSNYPNEIKGGRPDWYSYNFNVGNLAANTSGSASVTIQNDSPFSLCHVRKSFNLHGQSAPFTANISAPVTVQIQDTSSGLYLFDTPVPLMSVGSDAQNNGGELQHPRPFPSRCTIVVTVANNDGTNQYDNINVTLEGYRYWDSKFDPLTGRGGGL